MATKLLIGTNDLLTVNPRLSSEWDYEKNDGLRPEMFTAGSNKKMWWIGSCGHSWSATIASRNSGAGCPICARKNNAIKIRATAVRKNGSVKEKNPELIADWDYDKNNGFGPEEVAPQSHETVWWKCRRCGYEWQEIIRNRVNGGECPNCVELRKKPPKPKRIPIPLSTGDPLVASEWHPTKNGSLTPNEISVGSHTKVWWRCSNGHEWEASPNHRTSKKRNCPYCCANPRVLPGVNDLLTLRPDLAEEWNYEKNNPLTPDKVTASSSRKVWWRCSLGHEWRTSENHRNDGSGCPKCATARQTSFPEQAVYFYVSKVYPDAINGYTDIFNNHGMELDIYIPSLKTGIEYDGSAYHKSQKQKTRELKKYETCREEGITLIRLREDINDTSKDSCDGLILLSAGLDAGIKKLSEYGINVSDIDVERDRNDIDGCFRNMLKENSLLSKYPHIAAEWNYSRNMPLTPAMFSAKSNRIVWWKCSLGHEWRTGLDARVRGRGCPYCSNNRTLKGFNDLATRRPDLMKEWDYSKNFDLDPTTISPGSGKKAWWKCSAGHSWKAEISSRNKGHGCPYCAGNRV